MRNWLSIVLVALGGLALVSCGGSDPSGSNGSGGSGGTRGLTCETLTNPPPGCDASCPSGSDSECELGTFCLNGTCSAQCVTAEDCGDGHTCNARGRCVPDVGSGGTSGTSGTGGTACQSVTITPSRSIPNVMFLVDQSGSMNEELSGGQPEPGEPTRWEVARDAITAVVSEVDSIVRFGLTTYTSDDGFQYPADPPATCPKLPTQIDFGLDNASTISSPAQYPEQYPTGDGNDTPTGDSIDELVSEIQSAPPPDEGPTIIVLATDGLPDSCECPDGGHPGCSTDPPPDDARDEAVDAAERSFAAGIDLFFLWVGPLSNQTVENHVQQVANAGVGLDPGGSDGDATFWVGDDPQALEDAFRAIIADSISCDITMQEIFVDPIKACAEGDVRLDGEPLACSDTDGWRVKPGEDQVIELVGSACDTLKTGDVTFSAEFPCGSVVVE